jgi:hypothetical protein
MTTPKAEQPPKERKSRNKDSVEKEDRRHQNPGRPNTYTDAAAEEIVERLSNGEPLRQICRDEHMPPWRTVYGWIDADEQFSARIARAREIGEEAIFQDALRIADTPLMGEETEESENGLKIKRSDMLGHRKLQIDTRLKLLAKWNPRKYGEKLEVGGAGGGPMMVIIKDWTGRKREEEDGAEG